MPLEARDNPSTPSGAYVSMSGAWQTINDILAGPEVIRKAGQRYLPKNPAEEKNEYERRLAFAPWRPEFADILQSLSSKPFGKAISIKDGASQRIKALAEDIDGKGDNLTAFARPVFRHGIAKGMHAILVDNTGTGQARTQAEEKAAGVRPYWVSLGAEDIIDLKTAFVEGREQAYHVRIKECRVERDGYAETTVELVRELNREPRVDQRGKIVALGQPTWKLHEKQKDEKGEEKWAEIANGDFVPLKEIPLALFWTGERQGPQFCRPPLYALADAQIELYRTLSRNAEAFYSVGYPMYSANGMAAPAAGQPPVQTGPNRILYAGATGASWDIISANADSLRVLLEDVEELTDTIRRLGMQPLTQKSGGVSATASSIEGAKAHSTVEAWALDLNDVIEQAMVYTAQWLGEEPNVETDVDTDFSVEPYADAPLNALDKARGRGDISRRTYWAGLRRFDALPPDFDPEDEEEALAKEAPDPDTEDDITGALGDPKLAA